MNYTIDHSNQAIYFWSAKIGVTSALETIMHIKTGDIIQNGNQDEKTHEIFWKHHVEYSRKKQDYTNFKKIFFGRNPYHRIVSSFFDKVVCPISPGMDMMPQVNNYHDFVSLLHSCGMDKDKLSKHVDYNQFCDLCNFRGWDFYCELGKPQFDVMCITPETGVTEAKIILNHMHIKKIYTVLNKQHLFEQSKILHADHDEAPHNWYKKHPYMFADIEDLHLKSIDYLREYFWEHMNTPRTLRYMDFYNQHMLKMFNETYQDEFKFYNNLNKYYMIYDM